MNERRLNQENADLLAALCEKIAEYCRQKAHAQAEEGLLGIGHIIRGRTPDEWDDMAKRLRQEARET